ncbi:MAG: hypothetical protein R3231_02565 [bacterium]|nr:hypothetical protein [bacterium]
MRSTIRHFRRHALARRLISLVLILSVFAPMTGSLQILPAAHGDGPVLMTLNVCESGTPVASGRGHALWILESYSLPEPSFLQAAENGKEQNLTDVPLFAALDKPPKPV